MINFTLFLLSSYKNITPDSYFIENTLKLERGDICYTTNAM